MGVRAVIAASFSDIFAGNAFKNGIAAVELDRPAAEALLKAARNHAIAVDLEEMTVTSAAGHLFDFAMDPFRRECLLAGLDEIALTLASSRDSAPMNREWGSDVTRPPESRACTIRATSMIRAASASSPTSAARSRTTIIRDGLLMLANLDHRGARRRRSAARRRRRHA